MNKPKQIYLLAGGRPSKREILFSLIKTVFGENRLDSPIVAYIGVANGDDEDFFNRMADSLIAAGANRVNHVVLSSDRADLEKVRNSLNLADIVFISGGDVEEGIKILKKKKMVGFLRRLYDSGKPFFGLSAGSIMLAKNWVRWNNPDDDSTAELFPCLGFAAIICDTHSEQDNWEELITALKLADNNQKGYGIVSGTGIKVDANGEVEALGGAIHRFINNKGKVIRLPDLLPNI